MRLMIAAPRKTGNAQLRCLLASHMDWSSSARAMRQPARISRKSLPGCRSCPIEVLPTPPFAILLSSNHSAAENGIRLVAVLRHPFDLFVSIYEIAQRRSNKTERQRAVAVPWAHSRVESLTTPRCWHTCETGSLTKLLGSRDGTKAVSQYCASSSCKQLRSGRSRNWNLNLDRLMMRRSYARSRSARPRTLVRSSPVRAPRACRLYRQAYGESVYRMTMSLILHERYGDDVRQLGYELT